MADEKTGLTPEDADALIGAVGKVRNPNKGEWPGEWRCTGYHLDPADDRVQSVSLESVEIVPERVTEDRDGKVVESIPAHVAHVAPKIPVRWFRPNAASSPASTPALRPATK